MSNKASTVGARRPAMAGAALVVAAGLIAGGCSSSSSSKSSTSTLACPSKRGAAVTGTAPPATGRPAAGWTQPDADLASTRYVTSAITSANVSKLGVAWTVPLTMNTTHTDGAYATTPVIVNGVVYVQDLDSNVFAISLATGKVLWTHDYDSPNGGPDGVNVVGGVVYAATATSAVALDAATGAQLWSRTLIGNDHEGIAMAPGYDNGTVYVSTVPANVTTVYGAGGQGILWALNAKTGAPEWSWNQDQNLWGNPGVNSGAGLWYTPSFDAQGNIYLGIANPAPIFGTTSYPLGSSRPGPDLYTDSVVKLSPAGKLLWYYQLTPHDLYDLDLQNPPVLTTANGRPVVIAGGKAGIMIELDAQTGKLLWQLPVGGHDGHENDGVLTEHATPTSHDPLPAKYCLEPSLYGGMLTQLASNGSTTFAAVNDCALPASPTGYHRRVDCQPVPSLLQGRRRDGRGQPGHRHRHLGHPASVLAVRRRDGDQRRRVHHHVQGRPVRARRDQRRHLVQDADVRREQRAGRRRRRLRHRRRRRRAVQHAAEHDHRLQARGDRQAPGHGGLITMTADGR